MIKKKFLATVTAAAMMTSLFSMTAFASTPTPWGQNGGTFEQSGSGVAPEVVVEVSLPEDLTFVLNPFRLDVDEDGTKDEQVWTQEYSIINLSAIPVKVNVASHLEVADGVNVVDTIATTAFDDAKDGGELAQGATGDSKKNVAITQYFATGATWNTSTERFDYTYAYKGIAGAAGTGIATTATELKNLGAFALKKATDASTLNNQDIDLVLNGLAAPGMDASKYNTTTAAFKFGGAICPDTTSAYTNTDVSVKCTYTMNYLTDNMYAAYNVDGDTIGDTTNKVLNHKKKTP